MATQERKKCMWCGKNLHPANKRNTCSASVRASRVADEAQLRKTLFPWSRSWCYAVALAWRDPGSEAWQVVNVAWKKIGERPPHPLTVVARLQQATNRSGSPHPGRVYQVLSWDDPQLTEAEIRDVNDSLGDPEILALLSEAWGGKV